MIYYNFSLLFLIPLLMSIKTICFIHNNFDEYVIYKKLSNVQKNNYLTENNYFKKFMYEYSLVSVGYWILIALGMLLLREYILLFILMGVTTILNINFVSSLKLTKSLAKIDAVETIIFILIFYYLNYMNGYY